MEHKLNKTDLGGLMDFIQERMDECEVSKKEHDDLVLTYDELLRIGIAINQHVLAHPLEEVPDVPR